MNSKIVVAALGVVAMLCSSCTVMKVSDKNHGVVQTIYAPAWPWQDSAAAVKKLNVTSKTNGMTISLSGATVESTGATNLLTISGDVITILKLLRPTP